MSHYIKALRYKTSLREFPEGANVLEEVEHAILAATGFSTSERISLGGEEGRGGRGWRANTRGRKNRCESFVVLGEGGEARQDWCLRSARHLQDRPDNFPEAESGRSGSPRPPANPPASTLPTTVKDELLSHANYWLHSPPIMAKHSPSPNSQSWNFGSNSRNYN